MTPYSEKKPSSPADLILDFILSSNGEVSKNEITKKFKGKNQNNLLHSLTQKLLLTRKEACQLLNTGEKTALNILAKYGIHPIDLGKGRGNGLRWRTSEVIKLADILHTEAQKAINRRNKKPRLIMCLAKQSPNFLRNLTEIIP